MTTHEPSLPSPDEYAHELLQRSKETLRAAVEIVTGSRDADPMIVFPAPAARRADDKGIELTADQEQALRTASAELGFGRETNRTMSELGLQGGHVIIEGGQGHKMAAEVMAIVRDEGAQPASFIFAASTKRQIKGAEAETTARVLGLVKNSEETDPEKIEYDIDMVGKTEYDVAKRVAERTPGFEALDEPEVIPFGYEIQNNFATNNEPTGQLVKIGNINGQPVLMLRIDREDYFDKEEQKHKYRKQPGPASTIEIVDSAIKDAGDNVTPIAFVTSSTYQASREVDATRAALKTGRVVGVPTYGTVQLAEVKGEGAPAPAPINQLPGELHKTAKEVAKLELELTGL